MYLCCHLLVLASGWV
jgi:hypothetical protein